MRARPRPVALALAASLALSACNGAAETPETRAAPGSSALPVAAPEPRDPDARELAAAAIEDTVGFERLPPAQPGEWRARFDEPHVDLDTYIASDPVRVDEARRVLAFVPAGSFGPVEDAVMDATIELCGIWFDLPTRRLPPIPTPAAGDGLVRTIHNAFTDAREPQIHTAWFLKQQLPRRLPDDAVTLTAVTMTDLYPGEGWNYVFGEALLQGRVGVYSLRRHFPAFWGGPDSQEARVLALRRSLKLVTHEAGHTFGLEHCGAWRCNMNGSNSLDESDRAPLHLCPDCLAKLQWNRDFDVLDRYARLEAFFTAHGLDEEARWTRARIERIRAVATCR